ncbi:hypothetical protein J1N35_041173 [Gossypium stocksii]|uniref:Uncharacterized protein n=1 Tax=Gossypium stocksii TaxID=47602 RepID=A0A9D3ZIF1_9ROSI|nr:hypothetical protein J1N35_041173 [Gossypium stocksii]
MAYSMLNGVEAFTLIQGCKDIQARNDYSPKVQLICVKGNITIKIHTTQKRGILVLLGYWIKVMMDDALEPTDFNDRNIVVVNVGGGTDFTTLGMVNHVDANNA